MKLYAPLINPSVPAFLTTGPNVDTMDKLIVHFSHNRAVAKEDVAEMKIIIW
jgi:hypothetical protein